jgi:UDP-N-acetylenolpyruvoylglucosamine reductase
VSQGRIALGVAGRHNAVNALGAAAAALLLGYAPEAVFTALPRACDELPGRRYECVADVQGIRIIADYAHHPAELKVALAMAREERPARLVALFQPHRYTRTQSLGPEFPPAFAEADEVILLPVYAASETPLDGGCIEDLYAHFRQKLLQNRLPTGVARASCPCFMGGTPMSRGILQEPRHSDCQQYADTAVSAPRIIGPRLKLARTLEEAWAYLRQTLAPGDLVVIAGAGDVIGMVDRIREDVARGWPVRRDPEGFETALMALPGVEAVSFGALTHWSYYQVGGWARWRVEVADEAALAAVVRLCNAHGVGWRFVGAGANSWFSDLGEAGCVIRFAPGAFRGLDVCGDEVTAECGWMGQALLDRLEREGLSGLECLDSVPGTLGGWLAMNAGAHGGEIGARVTWIRCLNPNGEIAILDAVDCGFGYRRCGGLAGRVALACGLRLERTTPEQVAMLRKAVRVKRMPLSGLRCAGSVFRNPAGTAAGRVLDAAGCKGMRIGGAYVTDFHANIVATDGTATASDVLAVVMRMRGRAERHGGVQLTAEVSGFFR